MKCILFSFVLLPDLIHQKWPISSVTSFQFPLLLLPILPSPSPSPPPSPPPSTSSSRPSFIRHLFQEFHFGYFLNITNSFNVASSLNLSFFHLLNLCIPPTSSFSHSANFCRRPCSRDLKLYLVFMLSKRQIDRSSDRQTENGNKWKMTQNLHKRWMEKGERKVQ